MPSSCKDLRDSVAVCLQKSPCVMIDRHTPKECMQDPSLRARVPEECFARLEAFRSCRRGILDMTKRFRGNGPLSTGVYEEQLKRLSEGDFDPKKELTNLSSDSHAP